MPWQAVLPIVSAKQCNPLILFSKFSTKSTIIFLCYNQVPVDLFLLICNLVVQEHCLCLQVYISPGNKSICIYLSRELINLFSKRILQLLCHAKDDDFGNITWSVWVSLWRLHLHLFLDWPWFPRSCGVDLKRIDL